MDATATPSRSSRPGTFGLALLVVGVIAATVIAWGFVEWAHVGAPATCVVSGRVPPATQNVPCTTTVTATGRALIAGLMAVLLGAVVATLSQFVSLSRPESAEGSSPTAPPPPLPRTPPTVPPMAPAAPSAGTGSEVVVHCIELLDRRDPAVDDVTRQRLERALAEDGCSSFDPTGRAFDRSIHRAVDRVVTDDPAAAGTVAITERLGWRRRDQLIRPADVVVNVAIDE